MNELAFPMLDPNGTYTQYGITKRELFAKDIFCALISGKYYSDKHPSDDIKKLSVLMANDLINELEQNKP